MRLPIYPVNLAAERFHLIDYRDGAAPQSKRPDAVPLFTEKLGPQIPESVPSLTM
jgi:hypothetical protein